MELSETVNVYNKYHNKINDEIIDEATDQTVKQVFIQDYQLTKDRQKRKVKAPKRLRYADLITYTLITTKN